jgi:cysteine desulfurase
VRPEAAAAMRECLDELHANPSSAHREGQRSRAAVEHAREQVAGLVGARPEEVVFTSGGTEGDHLGVVGAALALEGRGRGTAISPSCSSGSVTRPTLSRSAPTVASIPPRWTGCRTRWPSSR